MNPYEITRVKLITLVKDFHDTYYPTMEVNYPKAWRTDVEHSVNPFVGVEITWESRTMGLNPRKDLRVSGALVLNHYARAGKGEKLFLDYSDLVYTYFGYKNLSGINFYSVVPYPNTGKPGFDGTMNYLTFDTDYFNI